MLHAVPVARDDTSVRSAGADFEDVRELEFFEIDKVAGGIGLGGAAIGAISGLAGSIASGASPRDTAWNTAVCAAFGFVGAGPGLSVAAARGFAAGGAAALAPFFMEGQSTTRSNNAVRKAQPHHRNRDLFCIQYNPHLVDQPPVSRSRAYGRLCDWRPHWRRQSASSPSMVGELGWALTTGAASGEGCSPLFRRCNDWGASTDAPHRRDQIATR